MNKKWNTIKDNAIKAACVIMIQDYVQFDEDFSKNPKITKEKSQSNMWIEMADELEGRAKNYLADKMEGIEEYEDSCINDSDLLIFLMNPNNRFEINDMIVDTVSNWLKTH